MSMALVKRPSLFAPLSDEEDDADAENGHGNDVERVCRGHYANLFHQSDHVFRSLTLSTTNPRLLKTHI
jgi:hypothetical protein